MSNNIINAMKVSVLAVVISFGLSYALAWTAPTATPPAGNVSAPINTSATAQTKAGGLTVGSITTTGAATVGTLRITTNAGMNKVLTSDALGNATWQDTQVYTPGSQVYTVPGTYTFTVPPLTTTLNMEVWGGGGGSGSNTLGSPNYTDCMSSDTYTGGGGGGSGGRQIVTNIAVVPGQIIDVVVGAGGAGGTQGGWGYSATLPLRTYGATGGSSYVSRSVTDLARAYGGVGGRNWDNSFDTGSGCVGSGYVACLAGSYSAPGGSLGGNPGLNCTYNGSGLPIAGSAGGAAVPGTNPISSAGAGRGGGPTNTTPNTSGVAGSPGKVVLWW